MVPQVRIDIDVFPSGGRLTTRFAPYSFLVWMLVVARYHELQDPDSHYHATILLRSDRHVRLETAETVLVAIIRIHALTRIDEEKPTPSHMHCSNRR